MNTQLVNGMRFPAAFGVFCMRGGSRCEEGRSDGENFEFGNAAEFAGVAGDEAVADQNGFSAWVLTRFKLEFQAPPAVLAGSVKT